MNIKNSKSIKYIIKDSLFLHSLGLFHVSTLLELFVLNSFSAALGLVACRPSLVAERGVCLLVLVCRLLIAVTSLVVEHRL